jgi:hypothetical protein
VFVNTPKRIDYQSLRFRKHMNKKNKTLKEAYLAHLELGALFFSDLLMVDDAMSEEMASLGLAGSAGAAVPDVLPAVVPPVNTCAAANPNAGGGIAGAMSVGESTPAQSVVPAVSRIATTAHEFISSA